MNSTFSEMWQKGVALASGYPAWAVQAVSGALAGFLIGFFLKMFGKPLFYAALVLILANYFLGYVGIIEFHSSVFLQTLGVAEVPTMETIFSAASIWMSVHVVACMSAIIGFLFGWRIG